MKRARNLAHIAPLSTRLSVHSARRPRTRDHAIPATARATALFALLPSVSRPPPSYPSPPPPSPCSCSHSSFASSRVHILSSHGRVPHSLCHWPVCATSVTVCGDRRHVGRGGGGLRRCWVCGSDEHPSAPLGDWRRAGGADNRKGRETGAARDVGGRAEQGDEHIAVGTMF